MLWAEVSAESFPGIDGFLGTRASFMLDVVFLAMLLIVPVLCWSVYLVRYRRNYALHKKIQLTTGLVLLLAVVAFEVDVRFLSDWEIRAELSPYYQVDNWSTVWTALSIHLLFAVPTPLIWAMVIIRALKQFPSPISTGKMSPRLAHGASHRRWGYLAVAGMIMTAITGWVFYYLAFVAS